MPLSSSLQAPDGSPLSGVDRRALARFLEQSLDHGFRLAIIEAASHAEREEILAEVADTLGPGLLRLGADELPGADTNLWQALQAPFTAHVPRCLALWGLDSGPGTDWARQLNVQRDLFVRDFAVPWLLFIHPASRVPLLQAAPDFCDFAILWLRDDSEPYAPVASVDMHAQDSLLSFATADVHNPLLRQAWSALGAARLDDARDALSRFALQPEQEALDRVLYQLVCATLERQEGHLARAEALVRDARNMLARQGSTASAQALARQADVELGIVLSQSGRYEEAEAIVRQTLALVQESLGREHPEYAILLHNLAGILRGQGKYGESERTIRDSLAIQARTLGHEYARYGSSLTVLANILVAQGRYAEAEQVIRDALKIKTKSVGPAHPSYSVALDTLAGTLTLQGKDAEAEPFIREAISVAEKTLGQQHPNHARLLHTLASILSRQGKHPEAEAILRASIPSLERTLGREHPDFSTALYNLSITLARQGKYGEAEPLLRKIVGLMARNVGRDHPDYSLAVVSLANMLLQQGKYAEAEPLLREALTLLERAFGSSHRRLCPALASLATVAAAQHRVREAIRLLERALQISQEALGADHPEVTALSNKLKQLQRVRRRR